MYGTCNDEDLVGKAVKGRRDQFAIATKCGITRDPANSIELRRFKWGLRERRRYDDFQAGESGPLGRAR